MWASVTETNRNQTPTASKPTVGQAATTCLDLIRSPRQSRAVAITTAPNRWHGYNYQILYIPCLSRLVAAQNSAKPVRTLPNNKNPTNCIQLRLLAREKFAFRGSCSILLQCLCRQQILLPLPMFELPQQTLNPRLCAIRMRHLY